MNHYPNNKSNRSKKRRQEYVEDETEETVDDLAYAATFAAMMGPSSTSNGVQQDNHEQGDDDNDDSNEISVGEEEEEEEDVDDDKVVQNSPPEDKDEESESEEEDYGDVNDNNLDEDDDDDESDDELRGTNQTSKKQDKTIAPKTENEVDAYRTPIQELEKHLEFRLTVEDDQDTASGSKKSRNLNSSNLILAGTVKHYMASDRTVVVESNPPVGGSSASPLDEGNLLVLRPEQKQNSTGEIPKLIPLGRIFEVFGPVSRPLYTIRLPVPPSESKERGDSVVETKETEEDPKSSEREAQVPDHWGPNGKYSLILADTNMVSVYFVQDEAKLLDTKKIMRNSGKGCDASNVYDEEVMNRDDMYYSDDEKERQAKNRRKPKNRQQQQQQNFNTRSLQQAGRIEQTILPQGFHAPPPPLPNNAHPTATQYYHNNQGIRVNQQQAPGYGQFPYPYPYPTPNRSTGSAMPPPPPPRRQTNQPPAYPSAPPPPYQY